MYTYTSSLLIILYSNLTCCYPAQVQCVHYSHLTVETIPKELLSHDLTESTSMSKISYCFALKNVLGPTGGPSFGGTMTLLRLPGLISFKANSNPEAHHRMLLSWHAHKLQQHFLHIPGIMPLIPNLVSAGRFCL